VPILRATNFGEGGLVLDADLVYVPAERVSPAQLLRPGDIVIATSSGSSAVVGKSALIRQKWDGAFGAFCTVLRPSPDVDARFVALWVSSRAVRRQWSSLAAGTNINNLKRDHIAGTVINVPPLAEQRRIVAAIEEQFSRLDAAAESICSAARRLDALWRAAIATAFPQDPHCVPLEDVLVKSIGGVWGSEAGSSEIDVDVFRITEFREGGRLDPTTAARRSITHAQLESRELRQGDLLIEKSGGGPDRPVGRVAWVPEHRGRAVSSNFVQLLRVDGDRVVPRYVFFWLMRRYLDGSAERHQTASTNIRNLKTRDYFGLEIPLPSIDAQEAIVAQLDLALTQIDGLRIATTVASKRSASLRRATLERAFRGELVPQDPDDEPASVLLERIRAERAAAPKPTRRKRVTA
jgi:type I restriction enzyme S subunit